uniref:Uncharacterized protein n=1 Tax=Avena sativa TaxID=4498 RepID=A0ACD5XXQ1_AVESA
MAPPPPPPTLLLPRRLLVAGGAKPRSFFNYSLLSVGRGCRRLSSPPSRNGGRSSSGRRFSSNAEQSTGSRRRWWFDGDGEEFGFEFEEEEGSSFGGSASWNRAFEEPWFAKVWRAYGYVLPVLLVSILAATGPRAFLMAMAIPLAQSALSLAVRAFSGTFGRRRRDYYSDYRSSGWEESEPEDGEDGSSYSTDSRYQQQPRAKDDKPQDSVPTATVSATTSSSSNSGSKSGSTGFGGWDELDAGDGQYVRSSRQRRAGASPAADAANTATGGGAARSVGRKRPGPEPTAARRRRPRSRAAAAARYRQSPLLMHLLVALFPFLGSCFRVML